MCVCWLVVYVYTIYVFIGACICCACLAHNMVLFHVDHVCLFFSDMLTNRQVNLGSKTSSTNESTQCIANRHHLRGTMHWFVCSFWCMHAMVFVQFLIHTCVGLRTSLYGYSHSPLHCHDDHQHPLMPCTFDPPHPPTHSSCVLVQTPPLPNTPCGSDRTSPPPVCCCRSWQGRQEL